MSFSDKITSLLSRPGQENIEKDDVPWWMRYSGRGVGAIGGFFAILFGVWNCFTSIITIDVQCLISGLWQIVAGFLVISCEAPWCCLFIDYVQNLSEYIERRPYWNKAMAYIVLALPAIILCPGLASIFGSGLIFTSGIIYGMMALGKKASAEEMRKAAAQESTSTDFSKSNSMKSNLVANAQPISLSKPAFDSNV